MAEKQEQSQPKKKLKVDEEYEPSEEGGSGSDSVELLSDELNEDEPAIDLDDYMKHRQRIIEEEQAEQQASESSEGSEESGSSGSSEESGEDSSSSEEAPRAPVRSKRKRSSSSSSD